MKSNSGAEYCIEEVHTKIALHNKTRLSLFRVIAHCQLARKGPGSWTGGIELPDSRSVLRQQIAFTLMKEGQQGASGVAADNLTKHAEYQTDIYTSAWVSMVDSGVVIKLG